jgi:hypothetical protein
VSLNRVDGHEESRCYLLVRQAFGDKRCDPSLGLGELLPSDLRRSAARATTRPRSVDPELLLTACCDLPALVRDNQPPS